MLLRRTLQVIYLFFFYSISIFCFMVHSTSAYFKNSFVTQKESTELKIFGSAEQEMSHKMK